MEWVGETVVYGPTRRVRYSLMSASLMGIQFVWSIQQVFASIELLDLGLTKSDLSIIWVMSPLCGLIVQPLVGSLSDGCTSSHGRRRPFMVWGAIVSSATMLSFAWSRSLGALVGIPAWTVAVFSMFVMDVALNACQATSRALIVDVFPGNQQKEAMAQAGVMMAIGHLIAYGLGRVRLVDFGFESQLKGIGVLFSIILLICIAVSSTAVKELVLVKPLVTTAEPKSFAAVRKVWTNVVHLDAELKGIFTVQLFMWYGWFTFLYYGSTYAAEVWQIPQGGKPDTEEMMMAGSFAMFVFSAVSAVASFLLSELEPNMLDTWIVSALVYAVAMGLTRFVSSYRQVLALFGVIGFSWAVTQWVPFALTSRRIHELPLTPDSHFDASTDSETIPVLNDSEGMQYAHENVEKGGVILGIHNCALTMPQFVSTFGSYLIYRLMDADPENPHSDGGRAVGATLQVGAFTALLAAAYTYRLKIFMKSIEGELTV